MVRRTRPGVSRFRVRVFDAPRNDGACQPPALVAAASPRRISSNSEDETVGTCSPSEAREMATRVLLKMVSASAAWTLRLFNSSDTSTLCSPLPSSATLPGVAEVRIRALSGGLIRARPGEEGGEGAAQGG